ncbi:MAG: hypothetical protein MI755_16410 [Sphingomonadales bacterium]|nr:hypothetical protein [Sphingomonadales bacterium]
MTQRLRTVEVTSQWQSHVEFRDFADALTDPATVQLKVVDPNGGETTYNYPANSEVTRVSAGVYHGRIEVDIAGTWKYAWIVNDGVGPNTRSFSVKAVAPLTG